MTLSKSKVDQADDDRAIELTWSTPMWGQHERRLLRTRLVLFHVAALMAATTNFSSSASANDTEAAIGLGGLVFTKSTIEMLSEELFVSSEQIVVKYRFRNNTRDDVTTLVAFPLPEVNYQPDDESPRGDWDVDFRSIVDGTVVETSVDTKAMLRGNDETTTLQRYGIPLNPFAAYESISGETDGKKAELRRLALIDDEGNPTWSLQKSFFWQQRFPAHKEITVEHRYRPLVGGTVYTAIGASKESEEQLAFNKKFCVDEGLVNDVKKKTKPGSVTEFYNASFSETWIEYILTTGANWSGPIHKFRLLVDKGNDANLVSFCGKGVHKVGPTQFEFIATDFVPKRDLYVLILSPVDSNASTENLAALSCGELWLRRNTVFKDGGYCFRSPRAISKFGNAGCSFDDVDQVPLSNSDRILINQIKSLEQSKGCPR